MSEIIHELVTFRVTNNMRNCAGNTESYIRHCINAHSEFTWKTEGEFWLVSWTRPDWNQCKYWLVSARIFLDVIRKWMLQFGRDRGVMEWRRQLTSSRVLWRHCCCAWRFGPHRDLRVICFGSVGLYIHFDSTFICRWIASLNVSGCE